MPLIAKTGDLTQGHCWPPAPMESQLNPAVYVQGQLAIVKGDTTMHPPGCTSPASTHPVTALQGSPTVFVNSIPVVRDADPMGCGDAADTIAGTVYADGGGNLAQVLPGTPPESATIGEQVGYTVNAIGVTYSVTLPGNIRTTRGIGTQSGVNKETWQHWYPQALSPQPSNGFRITVKEEFTGRSFISYQSQGAPNIPSNAPSIYRQPLDPFVRFEMVEGPFTVDSAGSLTLLPGFIPPKEGDLFVRKIPTTVRIIYGGVESKIDEEVSFDVTLFLT
jgi:uncharacterized Zn-binding protein involved in type VI secretion